MKRNICLLLFILFLAGCTKVTHEQPDQHTSFSDTSTFELCLYAPGDYGSANWRIPAVLCLKNGSLVALCDKRKYNEGDLPEDIDIVSCISTDGGHTWSQPTTIAEGQGYKKGFGDAALVECDNDDIVCVFVGGNGLWASTESDPIHSYVCRSSDGGVSWSQPVDITAQLWGSQASNSSCHNYKASFFGSGNGLRLTRGDHSGRIMFAAAMCRKNANVLDNYVVYSDDNGNTWNVSNRAYAGGDEAKLMELVDGRLLISVRKNGERGYNISNDNGENWGSSSTWSSIIANACNGDMLRVMATDRGDSCNLIVHSLPNSLNRENVSLFTSYDEGGSWQHAMTLFDGPSVYSSLTMMPNNRIGILLEKNPNGACEIWFKVVNVTNVMR